MINANCHGTALTKFLKLCESFTDKYEIFPLPAIQLNVEKKIDKSILNEADVFIRQDIRENNSIAYELSDKVTVSQPIYVDAGHPSKMVMYEIGKGVLESLNIEKYYAIRTKKIIYF